MDTLDPLAVARAAAQAGGDVVRHYFRSGVTMRSKQSYNLVSDADLESEQTIVRIIREAFPDHAIMAEEAHHDDAGADHLWIVDPLDGTNNFAHHIPHFAVSIAYWRHGQPQLGVIYNPIREDWYVATAGGQALWNGRRVTVGSQTALSEVLIGVGFYYDRGRMMQATLAAIAELFQQQIHGIRRFGTASLDLCQVGAGMFGGFFEYELAPWDFAAGALFVEAAGGRVTTALGAPLRTDKTSILASNGHLHTDLQAIIARHHP